MKPKVLISRVRSGLLEPHKWEADPDFRDEIDVLTRRGLLAAGVLAMLAAVLYVFVNLVLIGKEPVLYFPRPSAEKHYVVLWDKLLVFGMGALLVAMHRAGVRASVGRWVGIGVVVLASAASVFDDVQGGDVSFSPAYPTVFMLVAVGTLMLRPLQTLGMSVIISIVVLLGEVLFALPDVPRSQVVPEQVPFMFIVSVVLTGISFLLYVIRHDQHVARMKAAALERRIAAYAGDLEEKALALEREKERTEEHARALEEEQARTKEQARQLIEAEMLKDRFFANVSHEFRTPLTLILGPVRDALEGEFGKLPGRLTSHLSVMKSSGERLLRLVNDLLDLSKLDAGAVRINPRIMDVTAFLGSVVRIFGDLAERRGIHLTLESEVYSLKASFDPDAMEKVVYNLVSNALKFTPEGGTVRIRSFLRKETDGDLVCISVRDSGPGIAVAEIEKIFDRFHQASDVDRYKFEGTGLGLALARELVVLHGGDISVDSEMGFGSEFMIRFPVGHRIAGPAVPPAGTTVEVRPAEADALSGDEPHELDVAPADAPLILVVDNDADIRAYIRAGLQPSYRTVEAEDGVEAFERLGDEIPSLIICDVMMPRMDGFQFCEQLRRNAALAHIPVVLLTARADDESRIEGIQSGADDYMSKPFSTSELIARVENLIEIRRLLRVSSLRGIVEPSAIDLPSVDQAFLTKVDEIIEQHLGDSNFGVDWLADEVALSSRQLQRKMKKLKGLSAAGYIRLMRLKRAKQLLELRAANVSEVSGKVGFRDAAHFSKVFRQTFGVLPSDVLESAASDS